MNNIELEELLAIDRSIIPADGGVEFNRLIFSNSPYLLQHARNPVKWREWGDDAFNEARESDLPLFVSIGYSTCHWCHVMAHESFEDDEVARILNRSFIPVKVDREERPDLDDFYMTAARILTGGGGWPLNVFVDHEKHPIFSITYLPKFPKFKTPGFIDLLKNIDTLWKTKRDLITSNAQRLYSAMKDSAKIPQPEALDLAKFEKTAISSLEDIYDQEFGGFGMAVKFPMPTYLLFLLSRTGENSGKAGQMALRTLDRIIIGGIQDQIGGGFHRYAVDRKWNTPHFEKMLYDQALMISALCGAYQAAKAPEYLDIATRTANFCILELLDSSGGFYAGMDADSEGEEGLYYTWGEEELKHLLSGRFSLLLNYWDFSDECKIDNRITLVPKSTGAVFAGKHGIREIDFRNLLTEGGELLLRERARREAPLKDLKIVCSWNALLISAFIRLFEATADKAWLKHAENCATFILEKMIDEKGRLLRTVLRQSRGLQAFAEDYALLATALADIMRHNSSSFYRKRLAELLQTIMDRFTSEDGSVSFTAKNSGQLPIELPQAQDNVLPSTVTSSVTALIAGGRIINNNKMIQRGKDILRRHSGFIAKSPASCLSLIMAAEMSEG